VPVAGAVIGLVTTKATANTCKATAGSDAKQVTNNRSCCLKLSLLLSKTVGSMVDGDFCSSWLLSKTLTNEHTQDERSK
jgi:hypothetical protein